MMIEVMPLTLLITGFGPFPGAPFNPSAQLAKCLERRRRPALTAVTRVSHVFRTSYAAVDKELPALIARHKPAAILMFGLAARTNYLRIETRAQNRASMIYADADRYKPAARWLTRGAPSALAVRAPAMRLLKSARDTGVPARRSRDAGRYLCNALFWRGLEAAGHEGPGVVAFVHVPQTGGRINRNALLRAGEAIAIAVLSAARRAR